MWETVPRLLAQNNYMVLGTADPTGTPWVTPVFFVADGTQYYLGLNHLPGWTQGKDETQSTWTVPVFGNNPGDECY
ncbi:pyridoxamine 5'-phosphate oxidase family protein, partial [Kibdelosporangium lantanae]